MRTNIKSAGQDAAGPSPRLETALAPAARLATDAAAFAAEVGSHEARVVELRGVLSKLIVDREAILLDGTDSDLIEHDATTVQARRQLERAEAQLDRLARELGPSQSAETAAREAAAEAARVQLYVEAQTKLSGAVERICTEYPRAARAIVELIGLASECNALITRANRDLPRDAEPMGSVESYCSALIAAEPAVSREVDLWCYVETGCRLSPEAAERVQPTGDRRGELTRTDAGPAGWGRTRVELARFRETTRQMPVRHRVGSLVRDIRLPSIDAARPAFWSENWRGDVAEQVARSLAPKAPTPEVEVTYERL